MHVLTSMSLQHDTLIPRDATLDAKLHAVCAHAPHASAPYVSVSCTELRYSMGRAGPVRAVSGDGIATATELRAG